MNRIILIGNGFDLAHDMKTSYSDFMFQHIKECFLKAEATGEYNDELLSISRRKTNQKRIDTFSNLKEFVEFKESKRSSYGIYFGDSYEDHDNSFDKSYSLKINSPFLEHLLEFCCNYNWVDIENAYYNQLKELLDSKEEIKEKLNELNKSFSFIRVKLEQYLMSLKSSTVINEYSRLFTETIKKEEIVTVNLDEDQTPADTLIVNFNYTDSVNRYFSNPSLPLFDKRIPIIHIHGELSNPKNPIIFGFGDELDNDYKRIEADKRTGFLNFIKSFWYFKTSNYHDLTRFVEADDFQVYILGHSCGLSDRTMLNMIFEHNNCKSIKIFYHSNNGHNNFSELTQEISRHFQSKGSMRKKIVPFNHSSEMPQSVKK